MFAVAGVRLWHIYKTLLPLRCLPSISRRYVLEIIAWCRVCGDNFSDFMVEYAVVHIPGFIECLLPVSLSSVEMATILDLDIFGPGRGLFDRRHG